MKTQEILKNLRLEAGLTQRELSLILGIGQTTIAAYENGTREPRLFALISYASYFECSLDYLSGRECEFDGGDERFYTEEYRSLLIEFNELSPKDRQLAIDFIKMLNERSSN
ncbi:MAG: helix-turn-helix transcriptional regulator [Clostridia bacterium]|nr:helix-turn-helix transcriptional regulator [Clostridia bacterium]